MTQFADFVEKETGDRFVPKDNIGHVIVVKVHEIKRGVVTSNSPDGTSAVSADIVDLDGTSEGGVSPAVYMDTLLFGGAWVDNLTDYIGKLVTVQIELRTSKSSRTYAAPKAADAAQQQRAKDLFAKGDPFAPDLSTLGAQPVDENVTSTPPF